MGAGILTLLGLTQIEHPGESLHLDRLFEGTEASGALWASALFKGKCTRAPRSCRLGITSLTCSFAQAFNSYSGWTSASFVLGEVKDAKRTIVRSSLFGLTLCTALYLLVNVAYASAIPKDELSQTIAVAGLFARKVFGSWAERVACLCVAFSALGNVIVITYTISRVLREVAKGGIFPSVLLSTRPKGAPLAALIAHWIPTTLTIICLPAGAAYGVILDIEGYTLELFYLSLTVGLFLMRARGWEGIDTKGTYRASMFSIATFGAIAAWSSVVPWIPPDQPISSLPYWTAPLCGVVIIVLGLVGWLAAAQRNGSIRVEN